MKNLSTLVTDTDATSAATKLSGSAPVFIPTTTSNSYASSITPENSPSTILTPVTPLTPPTPLTATSDSYLKWDAVGSGFLTEGNGKDLLSVPRVGNVNLPLAGFNGNLNPNNVEAKAKPVRPVAVPRPLTPTDEDLMNSLRSLGLSQNIPAGNDVLAIARSCFESSRNIGKMSDPETNPTSPTSPRDRSSSMCVTDTGSVTGSYPWTRRSLKNPAIKKTNSDHGEMGSPFNGVRLDGDFQYRNGNLSHMPQNSLTRVPSLPMSSPGHGALTGYPRGGFTTSQNKTIQRTRSDASTARSASTKSPSSSVGALGSGLRYIEAHAQQGMINGLQNKLKEQELELEVLYHELNTWQTRFKHAVGVGLKHINIMNAIIAEQAKELRRRDDGRELPAPKNIIADKIFIIFNNISSWAASYYQFICPDLQDMAEALVMSDFVPDSHQYLDFIRDSRTKYLAVTRIAMEFILGTIIVPSNRHLDDFVFQNLTFFSMDDLAVAIEKNPNLSGEVCEHFETQATAIAHSFIHRMMPLRSRKVDPVHDKQSLTTFIYACQEAARVCHLLVKQRVHIEAVFPEKDEIFNSDTMKWANADNVGLNVSEPIRQVAYVEMQGAKVLLCMLPYIRGSPMDNLQDWKTWCKASVLLSSHELNFHLIEDDTSG
ncbi:hypothetical protein EX30DRAFT_342224 [Ascodesmis nigricans]|uniref:Uncharacterized protein n=1 Tax=Ascodesmis nigricans TaxID=341454 RepID=A0A4S2MSY8_9PEZI|nr:hypothetical protein EX30DRAFT_342224 [Ascodesmis nigricans]